MADVVEQLVKLQEMDRVRDDLQRRLDQVPVKLREHTVKITALQAGRAELEASRMAARAESDRAELELKAREEQREKIKVAMNAPRLSNREYEVLQEQLAGVLADINSFTEQALRAMETVSEIQTQVAAVDQELAETREVYRREKEMLEGSLADVRSDLEQRNAERLQYAASVETAAFAIYERVRRKHPEALSTVDGTIDRAAGRIGNDLHCSACYMAITANDAVKVLARKRIVTCKSCVRILYVP